MSLGTQTTVETTEVIEQPEDDVDCDTDDSDVEMESDGFEDPVWTDSEPEFESGTVEEEDINYETSKVNTR